MSDETPPAEKIGYRRPPVAHRWKPGQSGNPHGRPRRRSEISATAALERALRGRVEVEVDGRRRRLKLAEALIQGMVREALAGDMVARRELLKADAELEKVRAARREADRKHREALALARAAAEEKAAERDPELFLGWPPDGIMKALIGWGVVAKRGEKFFIRQWVVKHGLFAKPLAEEGEPWAYHHLVDRVGERLSVNEIKRARELMGLAEDADPPPPEEQRARRAAVAAGADPETWRDFLEDEEEEDRADDGDEAPAPQALPEPPEPPAAPAGGAQEEDWVDRLARAQGGRGGGDWMG